MDSKNRSYSQCGEDKIVDFLFENVLKINPVVYLDLGCNHPIDFNNTYLFYEKGFRGVSIDANPYFKDPFKKFRARDVFVSAGVGTRDEKANFYIIDPHTLSTFSKEEAQRYTENGLHKLVAVEKKPILSPQTILKKYFKKQLPNFLTIDVEGYDLQILQSIDFNAWRPAVICAETLTYTIDSNERKIDEIFDFLKTKDYVVYADTYINTIFVDNALWSNRV